MEPTTKGISRRIDALFHVLGGSCAPQGKPRAGAGNQEEQRHSPGKEEGLDAGYKLSSAAAFLTTKSWSLKTLLAWKRKTPRMASTRSQSR